MFERLGKSTKAVIIAAGTEASSRGEDETDDAHLLIGCVTGPRSKAASLLKSEGVTRQRIVEILDGLNESPFDEEDAIALGAYGIDLPSVVRLAEELFGPGALDRAETSRRRGPRRSRAALGSSAKQAIKQALVEAINLGDRQVEVEHLLLAVLRDPSPRANAVLMHFDLDYDAVRARLRPEPGAAAAS